MSGGNSRRNTYDRVAQLEEHLTFNQGVGGSSPLTVTTCRKNALYGKYFMTTVVASRNFLRCELRRYEERNCDWEPIPKPKKIGCAIYG